MNSVESDDEEEVVETVLEEELLGEDEPDELLESEEPDDELEVVPDDEELWLLETMRDKDVELAFKITPRTAMEETKGCAG